MSLLAPAAHSHVLPLEMAEPNLLWVYIKGKLSFFSKIGSRYILAERSHMTFLLTLEGYAELLVSVNTG